MLAKLLVTLMKNGELLSSEPTNIAPIAQKNIPKIFALNPRFFLPLSSLEGGVFSVISCISADISNFLASEVFVITALHLLEICVVSQEKLVTVKPLGICKSA
jgi:hypothetical protein